MTCAHCATPILWGAPRLLVNSQPLHLVCASDDPPSPAEMQAAQHDLEPDDHDLVETTDPFEHDQAHVEYLENLFA